MPVSVEQAKITRDFLFSTIFFFQVETKKKSFLFTNFDDNMLKIDVITLKADRYDVTNISIQRLSGVNVIIRDMKKFKDLHLS